MSYADQVFRANCLDILQNGVRDDDLTVRPHWEDGTPAHTVKKFGLLAFESLLGVALGAVIYYIVYQVIIFAGFDTDLLKMFSAVVVAVFLGAPHVKAQLKAHSRSKKGDSGHAENE